MRVLIALVVVLCVGVGTGKAYADSLNIAVAANFAAVMAPLAREFERLSGHKLQVSFGSSGKFYAQITQGAPFQIFLSADQEKAIALEKRQLAVNGSRFTYAVGTLVLWSPHPGYLDAGSLRLKNGEYRRLALANPRLAPYGSAAVATLQNLGLATSSKPKWVQGENVSQTYQFLKTANADLGFVALSQLMVDGAIRDGSYWLVPEGLYPAIYQDAVLLQRGKHNAAAVAFLKYLRSDEARQIIQSHGYRAPDRALQERRNDTK